MPTLTNCRILLVVDSAPTQPLADSLKARLLQMTPNVQIKAAVLVDASTLDTTDLIIVCALHGAAELRTTPLPLIACHAAALPELGMTAAEPDDDYGLASYRQVTVGEELNGVGLAGGFIGRQIVSKGSPTQGWGKPGTEAIVAASISQSPQRAAIFAYQQSAPMLTLLAPHRRVAFLIVDDQGQSLLERGWILFETAVEFAVRGGSVPYTPNDQTRLVYQQGRAHDHDVDSRLSLMGCAKHRCKDLGCNGLDRAPLCRGLRHVRPQRLTEPDQHENCRFAEPDQHEDG